jgi:fructose-1,6-bisphosphatase/inositol monophosphatase family enzyme
MQAGLWHAGAVIDAKSVSEISGLIRSAAKAHILPRFGRLAAGDVAEKAPGDLVTVADRAAEEALAERLTAILPGSAVVGEESVAADPALVRRLDGPDPVWIIDPIDGTENFVLGSPRFSTLVALAQGGRLLASWTYVPVFGTMATATAGGGAFVDGRRVRVRPPEPHGQAQPWPRARYAPLAELRHLDVVVSQPKWWNAQERARMNALAGYQVSMSYLDTSGIEYIELASGRRSAMVLTWELPWDHAAGLLLHAEAGGAATTADGSAFRLSGGNRLPLVAAPDLRCAAALHSALATPPARVGAAGATGAYSGF